TILLHQHSSQPGSRQEQYQTQHKSPQHQGVMQMQKLQYFCRSQQLQQAGLLCVLPGQCFQRIAEDKHQPAAQPPYHQEGGKVNREQADDQQDNQGKETEGQQTSQKAKTDGPADLPGRCFGVKYFEDFG